ncbi:hypothetical protein Dda_5908 [Drechslerella dactyloides]|uniref:Uncharacterized protein n=1 Tax=Drechslerella dactyloides TaxID=74499 RepID=A0AAD6NI42_DREDA|nr:hypothetical protein Dda_5908 [Drechslerella dactyloides]
MNARIHFITVTSFLLLAPGPPTSQNPTFTSDSTGSSHVRPKIQHGALVRSRNGLELPAEDQQTTMPCGVRGPGNVLFPVSGPRGFPGGDFSVSCTHASFPFPDDWPIQNLPRKPQDTATEWLEMVQYAINGRRQRTKYSASQCAPGRVRHLGYRTMTPTPAPSLFLVYSFRDLSPPRGCAVMEDADVLSAGAGVLRRRQRQNSLVHVLESAQAQ